MFHVTLTTDSIVFLIESQHKLNSKQALVIRALFDRILHPIPINTNKDQFLLYIRGLGGVRKTYLVKAFLFGLFILKKEDNVFLTALTRAVSANISSLTYHFALALYGN
jgi:hypothetical protein